LVEVEVEQVGTQVLAELEPVLVPAAVHMAVLQLEPIAEQEEELTVRHLWVQVPAAAV
jgi:hypothetical protein